MTAAIILAGGLGTRLRSAVPDLPKPMAPIAGRPFLAHQLDYWIAQGVRHFVLSVGYRHEAIVEYFGAHYGGATLSYVVEEMPRGTGGALLMAAKGLPQDQPILLLNGDTYFAVSLEELRRFARERDADWCFSLFRTDEPGRYMGVELSAEGRIADLCAGTGQPGRLANGGVYLVNPRALRHFDRSGPLSLENDVFPVLFEQGQRFVGREFQGAFIDIGVPHDYHRAASVLPHAAPH